MCGILGAFRFNNKIQYKKNHFLAALKKINHRGPDNTGYFEGENIQLGHKRLSIIDLSEAANQPLKYKNYTIVFNGEIYNYLEIRRDLIAKGYSFLTESDTEVIVIAYHYYGKKCVEHFNGMWAFAIYNKDDNSLFCSRDRFGIKPFNYSLSDDSFLFASESKSIIALEPSLKEPDLDSIIQYCKESVGAQNLNTWFKNIKRLAPAHNLIIKDGKVSIYPYWDYPPDDIKSDIDKSEEYKLLLYDSIKLRLRADVPIGATLSGGLDSTAIVALAKEQIEMPINTYTASFPGKDYDEFAIVQKTFIHEEKIILNRVIPEYKNYKKNLTKLIYHLESGHSSPAIFPLSSVLEEAKKDVIVFMEGQGADELLGGYSNTLAIDNLIDDLREFKLIRALVEFKKQINTWGWYRLTSMYVRLTLPPKVRTIFRKLRGVDKIYYNKFKTVEPKQSNKKKYNSRVDQKLLEQHKTGLVNLLHYGDAVSMMYSLESRLPFLDYRLVEFGFKLDRRAKIRDGLGKFIHRQSLINVLPKEILEERSKLGFVSPVKELFSENGEMVNILNSKTFKSRGIFIIDEVNKLLSKTWKGSQDNSRLLFRLVCVELWFRLFIDSDSVANES